MTQIDEGQATIHTAEPDNAADTTTHNVDAHMPPQPKPDENLQADPALVPHWNPDTNEWAPSNEQHETWGVAEPPHYDDPTATPVSESYGQAPSGTVPDARLNLIDSIRPRTALPAPVVRHEHEVRTTETGSETVRFRQEFVSGLTPTTLLAQNPNRKRALLRVLGSATSFVVTTPTTSSATVLTVPVPAGQTWSNISALNFAFTSDANVGLRQLQITVRDPLNRVLATYAMTVTQAQSLAQSYQTLAGTSTDTVTGTAHYFPNIFAGLVLTALDHHCHQHRFLGRG
jgi:hypothetical protein